MEKTLLNKLIPAAVCLMASTSVSGANIKLTIEGSGTVTSREADVSCTESCDITNALAVNTLVVTADNGWQFDGWQGQMCDTGEKAIISESLTSIKSVDDGAKTLAGADFNGDGHNDLAAISLFDGELTLLMNQGDGKFDKEVLVAGLNYPSALDTYDWDGDGDEDLVVAVYGQQSVHVYLNDGNGTLTLEEEISLPLTRPYAVAVADVNEDQLPDLLVSSFIADTTGNLQDLVLSIRDAKTLWFTNTSNGFEQSVTLSDKAAITLDAHMDAETGSVATIAAEIVDSELAFYRTRDQAVTRKVLKTGGRTYGAAFGDVDDDGNIDVLVADYEPSTLSLLYGEGNDGFATPAVIKQAPQGLTATAVIDLDGNGLNDLATGEFNTDVFYYFANKSYLNCVVNTEAEIDLIAVFSKNEGDSQPTQPAQPAPTPTQPTSAPEPASSSGSGGGSNNLWILIALLGLFIQKMCPIGGKL